MILTREDVKELTATGTLEVVLPSVPSKPVQSVQLAVATPAVAVVRVTDWWPHRTGGNVVVVELVKKTKPSPPRLRVRQDRIRLMKPRHGTTTDARAAMSNPSAERQENEDPGLPHPNLTDSEPEMIDQETENRFAHRAHQAQALREIEQQRRTLTERMDRVLEGCERLGVDPARELAAIERRMRDLEKKVKKAA